MSWHGQVEELLYEGESVRETVEMGDSAVVVTSHRVLAFTPHSEGANFSEIQRPNVAGITTSAQAERGLLERAGRIAVIAVVLLGAGFILDFESILGDVSLSTGAGATGVPGIGGVLGPLQTMLDLLKNLDDYLLVGGGLAMAFALAFVGVYWWQRDRTLAIEVAGGEDVHVPRPSNASDAVARLERAIAPRPDDDAGRDGGDDLLDSGGGSTLVDDRGRDGLMDDRGRDDSLESGGSGDPLDGRGSDDPLDGRGSDDPFNDRGSEDVFDDHGDDDLVDGRGAEDLFDDRDSEDLLDGREDDVGDDDRGSDPFSET